MKRVLIVYEFGPYEKKMYDLVVTSEDYEKVVKCHGHYMNARDWVRECAWLSDFLQCYPPVYASEDQHTYLKPVKPDHKYDAVVVTGVVV